MPKFFVIYLLAIFFFYACDQAEVMESDVMTSDVTQTMNINSGVVDREYRLNLKVDSGLSADYYYVYEGELPEGLELNEETGVISGTPIRSGKKTFQLALKKKTTDEIQVIPLAISIDKLLNLYKTIESFIDLSKSKNTSVKEATDNTLITFDKPLVKFYNNMVSNIRICKEGYLKMNSSTCVPSNDIDSNLNIVAPFANINFRLTASSKIYYQTRGAFPRRMLIVQYKNIEDATDPGSRYNFEVIFHEDSANIQFLYALSTSGSSASSAQKKHLGATAFIGVTSASKRYVVLENEAKIFRGTVATLHAPSNSSENYNNNPKWANHKYITNNVVTDYMDIARYNESAKACTANSDCSGLGKCIPGVEGNRCGSKDLTDLLIHDNHYEVRLPFNFKFFGSTFDAFHATENGYIYLGAKNNANIVYPKKNAKVMVRNIPIANGIFPMFSDINLKAVMGGHVTYNVLGTAPYRKATIMYDEVRIMDEDRIHTCSFELSLHETTNVIEFLYGNNNESDVCTGRYSSVGLKKNNSTYVEISANNKVLGQGKSITFVPNDANATSYTWVGVGNDKPSKANSNDNSVRNIFKKETNASFFDMPLRDIELYPVSEVLGEDIEELYVDNTVMKPYKVYDLNNNNGSGYTFEFKGKTYDKLFIDGNGAVSFGNNNSAEMIIAPMWGNVYYQSELESLKTPYEDVENDFMWIANSGDNTLSKINTHTGVKIGDYPVGSSPSRTAVGFDGSVWVGNRSSHDVTKLDRNGNFVCDVYLHSGCGPRGLALDKDENLWVGCYHGGDIYKVVDTKINPAPENNYAPRCKKLDIRSIGDTSSNLAFKTNNYHIYGFAFDKKGILWSSGIGSKRTIRIDTNKVPGSAGFFQHFPLPYASYGLVVDYEDNIWHARWSGGPGDVGVMKSIYDPGTQTISTTIFKAKGNVNVGSGRGVAIDRNGNIWVAYSSAHAIGKYAPDGTALELFPLNGNPRQGGGSGKNCTSPIGIGVDGDGDVWANCYSTSNSEEVNPNTGQEMNNFATGKSPYCYSDNTGFSLRNITSNLKKTQFFAKIAKFKVYDPNNPTECVRIDRKLVVQWTNVRVKKINDLGKPVGYTEANFQIIFDNGRSFVSNTPGNKCDETNLHEQVGLRDVSITYAYGSMKGTNADTMSGGDSEAALRAIYTIDQNNLQYEHVIGANDAGTIGSGSTFVISSEK